MRIVQRPEYEAFDGARFPTEEACRAHEAGKWPLRFVGLTEAQVLSAFDRTDKDLADAFEKAARQIIEKRFEDGEKRRKAKPKETPPAPVSAPEPSSAPMTAPPIQPAAEAPAFS